MPRLGRYVNDGRFCIDKKLVENAGRPVDLESWKEKLPTWQRGKANQLESS